MVLVWWLHLCGVGGLLLLCALDSLLAVLRGWYVVLMIQSRSATHLARQVSYPPFALFLFGEKHLVVHRAYSWLCSHESLLAGSGDHLECWVSNPARQIFLPTVLSLWPHLIHCHITLPSIGFKQQCGSRKDRPEY